MEENENRGLTIEKLKSYKGLENLSDQKAEKLIESIKQFVRLLMKVKLAKK